MGRGVRTYCPGDLDEMVHHLFQIDARTRKIALQSPATDLISFAEELAPEFHVVDIPVPSFIEYLDSKQPIQRFSMTRLIRTPLSLNPSNSLSRPYLLNPVRISLTTPSGTIIRPPALRLSVLNEVCSIDVQDAFSTIRCGDSCYVSINDGHYGSSFSVL